MSFRRILIANRGEIACRVIRTCNLMGIETVLAVSEADKNSLPAILADQMVIIGPASATSSYLNISNIIKAALTAKVDAIHPGYGFLSENAEFALACKENNIKFIGPSTAVLNSVGDKLQARSIAIQAGLPVVPGGDAANIKTSEEVAAKVGFPLLVKAVGGGGGRGMKLVTRQEDLLNSIELAKAEADAAFADARVYLERYVTNGRHIEVQVVGDGKSYIHLGDRDCSIQRRYQKLFEEAPAPHLPEKIRNELHASAIKLASFLKYEGLGTVEFLYDGNREEFYFLEMNARIQVEHPVTEMITGVDLVMEQIRIAEGLPLSLKQEDIVFQGHAIECRINAENWRNDFLPNPGMISKFKVPVGTGIRVDTHVQSGSTISPYYDSLVAKIIIHGRDRQNAIEKMHLALKVFTIEGVDTTKSLHQLLVRDKDVQAGGMDTGFFNGFFAQHSQKEDLRG